MAACRYCSSVVHGVTPCCVVLVVSRHIDDGWCQNESLIVLQGCQKLHVRCITALLSICRPNGCTVVSGVVVVVVVVVDVCNRSQMRTSKCTCLIFGVSIGLDPG